MLLEPGQVARILRVSPEAILDIEAQPAVSGVIERVVLAVPPGESMVLLRRCPDDEESDRNARVLEALNRAYFPHAPRALAAVGEVTVEEVPAGVSALALAPPLGSSEAAVDALAAFHGIEFAGLVLTPVAAEAEELPLHRLGFAAHERDPARAPLLAARDALAAGPQGLVHGAATAANVLLAPGRATLTSFGRTGFGPQLDDVAAFLLTAGLDPQERAGLVRRYARARDLDDGPTVDLVDLAGLLWGLAELLTLPRRQMMALGDDGSTAWLNMLGARIERGIRSPAGQHPLAGAIRAALWPG